MDLQTRKRIERLIIQKGLSSLKTYPDNGFVRNTKSNKLKNGYYKTKSEHIICLKDIGLDHNGDPLPAKNVIAEQSAVESSDSHKTNSNSSQEEE